MILENLKKYKVRLASNSPRRRELLAGLGIDYEVKLLPGIDETYPDTLKGEEIPVYIARKRPHPPRPSREKEKRISPADQMGLEAGKVLGKPKAAEEARRMLHQLSGRAHQVITGVCITTHEFQRTFAAVTEVTFDTLTDEEIDFYVTTYRPLYKAGAYGIQEWIGFIGASALNGSYFNVMGLPIQRLYQELKRL